MKNIDILTTLVKALGIADAHSESALQAWVDKHMPALIAEAKGLLSGGFDFAAVMGLATEAVKAAQDLKGIVSGQDRATVAQLVLVIAARAALPDMVEPWVIPLLQGDTVRGLIESAFQKVFGAEKAPLPPVIALNDDAWGRPATADDFGPSMKIE